MNGGAADGVQVKGIALAAATSADTTAGQSPAGVGAFASVVRNLGAAFTFGQIWKAKAAAQSVPQQKRQLYQSHWQSVSAEAGSFCLLRMSGFLKDFCVGSTVGWV